MKNTTFNLSPLAKAFAMTTAVALSSQAFAQEETEVKEKDVEKIQVTGSLGSLPGQDVESVFGFGKSILETPRSASTISQEQINRFADATGDHQWIHIDEQRAKEESPYQSTIAHGFLTLSLL